MTHLKTLLAAATLLSLAGCLLLSPDETPRRVVDLRFVADADGLGKAPCADPAALLATEDLAARVRVTRRVGQGPATVLVEKALTVGPLQNGSREITGQIAVPADPAAEVFLDVEVLYTGAQGREPGGDWRGSVAFSSGPIVTVESFNVVDQGQTLSGSVDVEFAGNDAEPVDFANLDFDAAANEISASYTVQNVDWDDSGVLRDIIAEMDLAFEPTVIFRTAPGDRPLADLVAGAQDTEKVLQLTPESPARLGEFLRGTVGLRFADGLPPSETGSVLLRRVDRSCD